MDYAMVSPMGVTFLNQSTRKAPAQPYIVRREFAQVNYTQRPLYRACRIGIAMIAAGLA